MEHYIIAGLIACIFGCLEWLAKGRVERMEKDIQNIKDNDITQIKKEVVWKDTFDMFCHSLENQLARIESKLDSLGK